MKRLITAVAAFALSSSILLACAGETAGQKADETLNSSKATSQKAWHAVTQQACTGTQAECDAQKAQNQAADANADAANKAKEAADRAQ